MGVLFGSVVVALAILAAHRRAPASASSHQHQGAGLSDLFCHGVSCGDVAPGALSSVCDPADPLKKFQPPAAKVAEATKAASPSPSSAIRRAPVPVLPRSSAIPRLSSGSFFSPYYRSYTAL